MVILCELLQSKTSLILASNCYSIGFHQHVFEDLNIIGLVVARKVEGSYGGGWEYFHHPFLGSVSNSFFKKNRRFGVG